MSTPVTWNGTTYNIPAAGELNWSSLSNFLIALGNNAAIAGGAVTYGSRVVTSTPDTVGPTDTVVLVNVGSSSTIDLPTTTGNTGRILVIADSSGMAATNNITIDAYASEVINGSNTYVINSNRGAVILVGASNSWNVLASYEGSQILNSRTTATNANTASAIVARDASGNFTAGTITAALTGNATTATSATSITGNLTGDVTSSGMATTITSGVITNAMVNVSAQIADTKLATISTASKVSNSATTATNANTANAIVARDASGNFSAGTITADLSGNATTATTATSATSAANLTGSNLTGDVTNVANAMTIPAGTITNAMVNASAAIVDTKLDTISTALKVSNSATTAASANTASAIVARDASGNFTAGTITAALTGNASTATSATSITGNLTGDVTSSGMATTITSGIITNAMVNASAGIVDTKLATISTAGKVSNSATTATSANTNSAIVARNGSGDFSAGAVTVTQLNSTGVVGLAQIATPTAPLSTVTNVYAKTDGKIYRQTSDGEFGIGSGSGSGINYLTDWNDGSKSVNLVSTVAAAGNVSVTGSYTTATSAWYADATSGASVTAGSFIVGKAYVITFVGSTNFVSIGAASSTVGVTFIATGVGSGTGTAGSSAIYSNANITLRGTTNYLTQLSSASTSGATFVQSPVFCVDGTDLGKALAIQFDVIGNTTADDWDVVAVRYDSAGTFGALIPIAGIASSTTGTASAQVPTGTTTFTGFFITGSTASDVYSIRWRRRAGSVAIRLDNLIVGPNSVMLGTAITDWQTITIDSSYLVNGTGITLSATRNKFRWRRVGNSMEVQGNLGFTNAAAGSSASAFGIKIPNFSSLTISSNLSDLDDIYGMGRSEAFTLSNTATNALEVRRFDSTSVQFCLSKYPAGSQYFIKGTDVRDLGGFVYFVMFNALIPIAQWSSNVTMADRAVEEFAWSTNTTTTAGNTQTADGLYSNGPSGTRFYSFASTTANSRTTKYVRFQTPIQATDLVTFEFTEDAGKSWYSASNGFISVSFAGTSIYGVNLVPVSGTTTDYYVQFGNKGYLQSNATYAGDGSAWSVISGNANYLWRVRKVSGGAAVGFPVGARNVIGDTTGTAVPAGYIGEVITSSVTTATNVGTTGQFFNLTSITLTPGTYLINAAVKYNRNTATFASTDLEIGFSATTGNSSTGLVTGVNFIERVQDVGLTFTQTPISMPTVYLRYDGTTATLQNGGTLTPTGGVFYLKGYCGVYSAATPQYYCTVTAVRIA